MSKYVLKKWESDRFKQVFFAKLAATMDKEPYYWYPLFKIHSDIPVLAFESDYFNDRKRLNLLKQILKKRNVYKVCVVHEFELVYWEDSFEDILLEEDEDGFVFPYYAEQYIFDETKSWMIYTSHEFTITFAGKWLVGEIASLIS